MVTIVTMSHFSIFCSSQIVLPHQLVHVRMTSTILLISTVVRLSDFAEKFPYFQCWLPDYMMESCNSGMVF